MSLKLTIVGCGDAFGSGGRRNTCFHLESGEGRWFVDFGATSLVGALALGIDTNAVDAIILSHLHGDHFGGIPFLILHAHFVTDRRSPLTIAGPPGTEARVRAAQEVLFPESSKIELDFDLRFVELLPGTATEVCGAEVSCVEVRHPSGAPPLALRIAAGDRLFAFSGDTEWLDVLTDVARDADLFVCECYAFQEPIPYHVCYREILDHLDQLTARRIMLTHLGPEALGRMGEIAANFLVSEDGMVVEV
ncbi:MBL fold metallo-hydrolase [Microbaculum marinum]|uniref:MBL fold metallo-hydrolase n=1 Tax=Microbaculum marinum TaxID=1764581 RepID=A0AAW9RVG3_9HYPH